MARKTRNIAKAAMVLIILFLILKYRYSRYDNHPAKKDYHTDVGQHPTKKDYLTDVGQHPAKKGYLADVGQQDSNNILSLFPKPTKKTIQWFDFFHNGRGLRNSRNHIKIEMCEYSNCDLLEDYTIPDNDSKVHGPLSADAIIIQGIRLRRIFPPIRRDENQVFVYAERETGQWISKKSFGEMEDSNLDDTENKQNPGLINWTMTYRNDSDIFMPYGEIVSRQEAYERGYIQDLNTPKVKDYDQIYYNKTHDVVWLVSDCNTKSKRELYVQKLRKHINVDIYGECGSFSCPRHDTNCINDIIRTYKFILSFENTFHKDYVTEKLFSWFSRDIVQIVYGMANYESITPSGSVINANNFHSPEELAVYMRQVGSSKHMYVQYLKIKDRHYVIDLKEQYQLAYCKLCEKLNDLESNRRTYPDIALWWPLNDTTAFQNLYSQALA